MRKARKPLLDEFHKRFYAIVAVEDVRRVDLRLEHQPLGVHKQMALRVPFTFLPASKPRSSAPTAVVLTLWLSTMPAALGCGFLPKRTRALRRSVSCSSSQVSSMRQKRRK